MQVRHGDVLIDQVDTDVDGQAIPREGGKIILAHGEVTGHAHAIAQRAVRFVEVESERYLSSTNPFVVRHEEHAPIKLPAGTFKVVRQREYSPEAIRNVAD